ncbi:MAG: hypothetical protein ACRDUX_15590 [Mycobacterium sp.]
MTFAPDEPRAADLNRGMVFAQMAHRGAAFAPSSAWGPKGAVAARYAEPVEISHPVEYLASRHSSFLTGQTISINGGQVIGGF